MKVHIDELADALYLRLDESNIIESEEVYPGIILDFNEHNQVVGIEVLNLKSKMPLTELKKIQFGFTDFVQDKLFVSPYVH